MLFFSTLIIPFSLVRLLKLNLPLVSLRLFSFFFLSIIPILSSLGPQILSSLLDPLFCVDEVSILLVYITIVVLYLSFYSHDFKRFTLPMLVFFLLFLSSYVVFTTSSLFLLYIFYEASLVPISFAILKWGHYPDRGVSSLIILLFTSSFTFPFTIIIINLFLTSRSFLFLVNSIMEQNLPCFFSFWLLCSFAVKLPIYGVHYWLPIAHVEAPTFGSIVLAGLLLKIGGCGLLRSLPFLVPSLSFLLRIVLSYVIISVVLSSLVTRHQSDFKRLVAYSSVVHISLVVLLILLPTTLRIKSLLMLIVFHGLSSPILFYFVGVVYKLYTTRVIYILRGLIFSSPIFALLATLSFTLSVPVPPFTPFVGEVLLFISSFALTNWVTLAILSSLFLVLIYNMLWFIGLTFDNIRIQLQTRTPLNFLVIFSFVCIASLFMFLLFLF